MLIGAVRGGHVEIVRALLNKYADIDIRGQVGAHVINHNCHNCWFIEDYTKEKKTSYVLTLVFLVK